MIDATNEHILSLTEAAATLPARRAGKRPNVSCLYRWSTNGLRGVVLESIQIGGTRCTSREALDRFFAALTKQSADGRRLARQPQSNRSRARADARLRAAGI